MAVQVLYSASQRFPREPSSPKGRTGRWQGSRAAWVSEDADRNTGAFKMNPKVRRAPGPEPIPSPAPNPVLQPPCAILWQNMGRYFLSPDLTGSLRPFPLSPTPSRLHPWLPFYFPFLSSQNVGGVSGSAPSPLPFSHLPPWVCTSVPGSLMSSPPVVLNPVSNTLVTNILCHHPVTSKGNDIHMHIIPKRKPSQCSN